MFLEKLSKYAQELTQESNRDNLDRYMSVKMVEIAVFLDEALLKKIVLQI